MDHWTSHAFHATVVSPHLMYGDVTVGFGDGLVTFSGRPFRSWRVWSWGGRLVRFLIVVAAAVALAPTVLAADLARGVSGPVAIAVGVTAAALVLALWIVGGIVRRVTVAARERVSERVTKLPVADVTVARLSGKTLFLRAPFDQSNRSGRWKLRLDSPEQGQTLMALLGRL